MKQLSLLLLIVCCSGLLAGAATAASAFQARPQPAPLKLNQIERLLDLKFEDHLLAAEITQRGLDFRVNAQIIEQLQQRGLGVQAKQSLLFQEERQAYAAFADKNAAAAKRLALGREFLRLYPRSEHFSAVQAVLPELEVEAFKASFQAFSQAPDLLKLSQLFESGQLLLKERADPATVMLVRAYQAIAAARGALGNFYQDLPRSQALTKAALQLLEAPPPANVPPAIWQELREQYLGELYRAQALYLLRLPESEPEQALQLLERALQVGQANVAKEAMTYWLRAVARDGSFQKQAQTLTQADLSDADRQTVCARLTEIREKLVEDYTRVVALSASASGRSLQDEANQALKKLLNRPRPCVEPAEVAEVKNPPTTSRRARQVKPAEPKLRNIFIRSKTVYLNATLLEVTLLKQADFQNGGWRIVRNQKEADLLVEISLPFLTWNWTYEVTQPATSTLIATGKIREALAAGAVPRLAAELSEVFKRLRAQ